MPAVRAIVLLLLPVFFLVCQDNPITTPVETSISSPAAGDWVSGTPTVLVSGSASGSFDRIGLYVNGSLEEMKPKNDADWNTVYYFQWQPSSSDGYAPTLQSLRLATFSDSDVITDSLGTAASDAVEVYSLHPRQITTNTSVDIQPEWSNDSTTLIFKSNRQSSDPVQSFKIYTIKPDGTSLRRIYTDMNYHGYPDWSPNEEHVIFNSFDPGNSEIYTASVATGVSVRLTDDPSFDDSGRWSPDGTKVVFFSTRTGSSEMYTMEVSPTGSPTASMVRLTDNSWRDEQARWSPNSRQLIYESNKTNQNQMKIWLLDLDTAAETQVTFGDSDDGYPNWSPDGTHIIYDSLTGTTGNRDVFIVPLSAAGATRKITFNEAYDDHPSWSPDGKSIAFASKRSGNWDIWVVGIPSL